MRTVQLCMGYKFAGRQGDGKYAKQLSMENGEVLMHVQALDHL